MKQLDRDNFSSAVTSWDRSHRLVGKEDVALLIDQSVESLNSLLESFPEKFNCFVDVGAGSGLLGFPLLFLSESIKVCFVEPDPKKAAFILSYLSSLGPKIRSRGLVQVLNVESVSRETLENFAGGDKVALLARAFSGPRSLNDAIKISKLSKYPTFQFTSDKKSQKNVKYLFELLNIL